MFFKYFWILFNLTHYSKIESFQETEQDQVLLTRFESYVDNVVNVIHIKS